MHVLIWTPPWPTQGADLFFGLNAFKKGLLVQANALISQKCKVTIAFPDQYSELLSSFKGSCDFVSIDTFEASKVVGQWSDPSPELYRDGQSSDVCKRLEVYLAKKLPKHIDCILLWETPAPFFRTLYPDALIVNQMPGGFNRAPYPQTTMFDIDGLYRRGTPFKHAENILSSEFGDNGLVSEFKDTAKQLFSKYPLHEASRAASLGNPITLLPLQISDHYAFRVDTGFSSQSEYCIRSLEKLNPNNTTIITQYVSSIYRDEVMSPEFLKLIRSKFPNVFYEPTLDKVPSVSQHLIQSVQELAVATSGIPFQALIWDLPINVIGNTQWDPFDKTLMKTNKQRESLLSFVLTRHQPLTSKIHDGNFLVNLIEDMNSRKNLNFLDRFPSFDTIDRDYSDCLLSEFRENVVKRDFIKLGRIPDRISRQSQFERALKDHSTKVVSFDLFDTLVIRGFENPADLYRLVELEINQRGLSTFFGFADKRLAAELEARRKQSYSEISLDDIYSELQLLTGIDKEESDFIQKLEEEVEVNSCKIRDAGKSLFDIAESRNLTIIITSDMYLSRRCIDKIVSNNKYHPSKIFLSSEIGITKKSGDLFKYILKELNCSPSDILHVGDNSHTDIKMASVNSIPSFHIPKSTEYFFKHPSFSKIFRNRVPITSLARSVIVGAVSHKLFDDAKDMSLETLAKGNPWLLGYIALGPILLGMATWSRRTADEMGLKKIYFLSREGKVLKDAYERVCKEVPVEIEAKYLYGSRRAIRVAQLNSFSDILELANQTIDHTATVGSVLEGRFGLNLNADLRSALEGVGYKSTADSIGTKPHDRAKFVALLKLLQDIILQNSKNEAEIYKDYLREQGLFESKRFAVADVGWNANMQGSLGQILGKPLTGLYYCSLDTVSRWQNAGHVIRGYAGEGVTLTQYDPILQYRLMLETMLCDSSASIIRIKRTNEGKFVPVFEESNSIARVQLVNAIHAGALSFVDEICKILGPNIKDVNFSPDLTGSILKEFLGNPAQQDAQIFAGQTLDDGFSGAQARYLLAPINSVKVRSYWDRGAKAKPASAPRDNRNQVLISSELSLFRKLLVPVVLPFISFLGNKQDVVEFKNNPSSFFFNLRSKNYQKIGRILFPPKTLT